MHVMLDLSDLSDFCVVSKGPAECMCRAHSVNVQNVIILSVKNLLF